MKEGQGIDDERGPPTDLAERAAEFSAQPLTGRSHNVAAQATTMGKRFASAADELLAWRDAGGPVEKWEPKKKG